MPERAETVIQLSPQSHRRFRSLLFIPLLLALVGACYLYGRLIEVNWIRIERVEIPIRNLPEAFEGFTIVQLSDLHVVEIGKRERKLPEMVNGIGADAIFMTGDYTQTREGESLAASVVAKLKAKYGVWGVLGNWDPYRTAKVLEEVGVKMLLTQADVIDIRGEKIGIIGLRFGDALRVLPTQSQRQTIASLKAELPEGIPIILLEHTPRIIYAAQEENIDLVLSGHTHGGQVHIPFGPAIETPCDMGIWYTNGLFKFKNTFLYINPGIGLEPGPNWMQVRFWCRPEITVIRLMRA